MSHPEFDFYIHVDTNIDISKYRFLEKYKGVRLIRNRVKVRWAGYSTVAAIFSCIDEILNTGIEYGYINLMSGQDYPIKSAQHIYQFLLRNKGRDFLEYHDFDFWTPDPYPRVRKYNMTNYDFKGRYVVQKMLNFALPDRKPPVPLKFYGSSMWWTIAPESARYVMETVRGNSALERFFKHTWGPDEFVFQTILLNSPLKTRVVNKNMMFLKREHGAAHPDILQKKDITEMLNSDKLFARKFDLTIDGGVLDLIDARVFADAQPVSLAKNLV
jgi:Core-2/I-Branching enzyme